VLLYIFTCVYNGATDCSASLVGTAQALPHGDSPSGGEQAGHQATPDTTQTALTASLPDDVPVNWQARGGRKGSSIIHAMRVMLGLEMSTPDVGVLMNPFWV